jgi:crotonobetainyl-CoA:carnitine CoA-transferase CaiB-like acyl-CoA transferase
MSKGALEGLRILELALQYPGPYCTMLLADLGAEVLKIERPDGGDPARQWPAFFQSINRNRRSLTLDLKSVEGRGVVHRLIKQYDIISEGFRPGVARRLGIDYESLREINPQIIY